MSDNLILVTIDSLRADHCGYVSGDDRSLTPVLDGLAEEGVAYRNAIAPGPRTPSSLPPLFTGVFHQYRDWGTSGDWRRRRQRIGEHLTRHRTIAETLHDRGYNTAAYTMNPWTAADTNFDRGFDEFTGIYGESSFDFSSNPLLNLVDTAISRSGTEELFGWRDKRDWFSEWTAIFPDIDSLLGELDEPYFLWVFLLDCHQPYFAPRAFREEITTPELYYSVLRYWRGLRSKTEVPAHVGAMLRKAYRDSVRSVDAFLERLLEETRGDPSIVVHADHGEAHGEHGTYGHESQLYDVNLRVPLVAHNVGDRSTVDEQISLRRLPDLLSDVATAERIDPTDYTSDTVLSATEFADGLAVRSNEWKYFESSDGSRLYDLRDDPDEKSDCLTDAPEVAAVFRDRLGSYRSHLVEQHRITRAVSEAVQTQPPHHEQ